MWDKLFNTTNYLEKGINASWLRNEVISNNIANADTPGFKTSQVKFETIMEQAIEKNDLLEMDTTNEKHIKLSPSTIDGVSAMVVQNKDSSYRYDENNVDIETEMAAMAKNSIQYYTLVSKLNSEFSNLSTAINGDR